MKTGLGLRLRYTRCITRFGKLAIGATDAGICCALFFEHGEALDALGAEFPVAEWTADPTGLEAWAHELGRLLEGNQPHSEVPLDLLGTPFQRRVWNELVSIPEGSTTTYARLAERLGTPTATRAVAGACARNHIAVAVPCHRVIRTGGGLGGYRWGLERKAALLQEERRRAELRSSA